MRPRASDEEAHRPSAESEALHGNQQWCNKSSILAHPICLSLDCINSVMSQSLIYRKKPLNDLTAEIEE
ncbi:hypothetical protein [Priestia megaterium]|uniref:hypothetical protein n=1 Tax=Priestia megaterium TaxID=1404 RepID=UPI002E1FCDE3|nr:hypothetical protein [Priestia megaterium]MED4251139.1 hypothetical protein [Priestia megaterium]MED4266896.1 hypothetical protein [Priestia megaterium]MED4279007.1 hypothetical protein [Priestia megaterium]MED4317105.1 hypothetical protein [Priestia megaterium]